MKKLLLTVTLAAFTFHCASQSDRAKINKVLIDYIQGTSNGEIQRIESAFHSDLNLYSVDKNEKLKIWKGSDYIKVFTPGEKTSRIGKVLSIDYENNAATAKVEIKTPNRTFIDYFLLLKLNEGWKIIHKSYTQKQSERKPQKTKLSPFEIKELKEKVSRIQKRDQMYRRVISLGTLDSSIIAKDAEMRKTDKVEEYFAFTKSVKKTLTKKQIDSLWKLQHKLDFDNYVNFKSIINQYGYPSPNRLNIKTDRLFQILLHPPTQLPVEEYLSEMQQLLLPEVKANRMKAKFYALFVDDIKVKILKEPQLYGTVKHFNRKTMQISPPKISNITRTNKARKEIGLPELKDNEYILIKRTVQKAAKNINDALLSLLSQKQIAGVSFGIQKAGEQAVLKYQGYTDLELKRPVNSENQFPIASVTKVFTSTAILKLIEEGKLSLNDNLKTFFPNYPNGENITIYHLLNNTSGIKAWHHSKMPQNTPENFPNCPMPHKYIERMNPRTDFDPGTHYNYSNTNFVLLAEIVELRSKQSFQDYLNKIVFKPLGLKNTVNNTNVNESQKVTGYELNASVLSKVNIETVFGAGSIFSNSKDLLKFIDGLKSGKIISKESFNKMTSHGLLANGKKANTANYFNSSQSSELWKNYGYGLGIELVDFNGKLMLFHSGLTTGAQAFLAYFPHNDTSFSIVINTQGRFRSVIDSILKNISEIEN